MWSARPRINGQGSSCGGEAFRSCISGTTKRRCRWRRGGSRCRNLCRMKKLERKRRRPLLACVVLGSARAQSSPRAADPRSNGVRGPVPPKAIQTWRRAHPSFWGASARSTCRRTLRRSAWPTLRPPLATKATRCASKGLERERRGEERGIVPAAACLPNHRRSDAALAFFSEPLRTGDQRPLSALPNARSVGMRPPPTRPFDSPQSRDGRVRGNDDS